MIDQNCGNFIDKEDMYMLTSLGRNTVEEQLEWVISEASGRRPLHVTLYTNKQSSMYTRALRTSSETPPPVLMRKASGFIHKECPKRATLLPWATASCTRKG